MALWRGIGARKDAVRGTSPIEVRKALAALFARPGVLPGGANPLLTGDATWAYNVGIANFVTSRGASDGDQLYGNDGVALIGATGVGSTVPIAPGAGLSRIDIAWTRHPTNTENADTSSEPLFGVASGVAASSNPVAPVIPAGALEIGRNTMTSAATSTSSVGNTITQSAQVAALVGSSTGANMGTPATTASNGTAVALLDSRDAVLGNYTFTAVAGRRYRAVLDGAGLFGDTLNDVFYLRIRNGGAATPTTASTAIAVSTAIIVKTGSGQSVPLAGTFVPGAGVQTIAMFTARASGTGTGTPTNTRELYVVDLGPA